METCMLCEGTERTAIDSALRQELENNSQPLNEPISQSVTLAWDESDVKRLTDSNLLEDHLTIVTEENCLSIMLSRINRHIMKTTTYNPYYNPLRAAYVVQTS